MLRISIVILALLASSAFGAQQNYNLQIVNKQQAPDGVSRLAISVNGGVQGPLLTANKDDTLSVNVQNKLTVGPPTMHKTTSIHWHGINQKGTQDEDGVAFITQCPIISGQNYQYTFPLSGQSGTFWYHSHLSTQYCDGLRGPMVIYDPNDPLKHLYDIDNANTVITLNDWYAAPSLQSFPEGDSRPFPPTAVSHLINGQGRRSDSSNNGTAGLSTVNVVKGKRYRFRLINMGCEAHYQFWIDKHQLQVIEVDGVLHNPQSVDSLTIFPGQRYSVVLNADQPVGNYWIRIVPNESQDFDNAINSAILRYQGASTINPPPNNDAPSGPNELVESSLSPLQNPGAPTGNVQTFRFIVDANFTTKTFTLNGTTFQPPSVPVLLQILNGQTDPHKLLPNGSVFAVERNSIVEITIPGGDHAAPHPFHLHGHSFDVIRSSGQSAPNLKNPPRRDVVSMGNAGDEVTIRFRTDNPGPWIFHCHIDWHLDAGLALVFAERTSEIKSSDHLNPKYNDLCPAYNKLDAGDR